MSFKISGWREGLATLASIKMSMMVCCVSSEVLQFVFLCEFVLGVKTLQHSQPQKCRCCNLCFVVEVVLVEAFFGGTQLVFMVELVLVEAFFGVAQDFCVSLKFPMISVPALGVAFQEVCFEGLAGCHCVASSVVFPDPFSLVKFVFVLSKFCLSY